MGSRSCSCVFTVTFPFHRLEEVSKPAPVLDESRLPDVIANEPPEPVDTLANILLARTRLFGPCPPRQSEGRNWFVRMQGQLRQEGELSGGKLNGATVDRRRSLCQIQVQGTHLCGCPAFEIQQARGDRDRLSNLLRVRRRREAGLDRRQEGDLTKLT